MIQLLSSVFAMKGLEEDLAEKTKFRKFFASENKFEVHLFPVLIFPHYTSINSSQIRITH